MIEGFKYGYGGSIDFKFSSSPVTSFSIVADGVIGFIPEPVRQGAVLPLLLCQSLLHQ